MAAHEKQLQLNSEQSTWQSAASTIAWAPDRSRPSSIVSHWRRVLSPEFRRSMRRHQVVMARATGARGDGQRRTKVVLRENWSSLRSQPRTTCRVKSVVQARRQGTAQAREEERTSAAVAPKINTRCGCRAPQPLVHKQKTCRYILNTVQDVQSNMLTVSV